MKNVRNFIQIRLVGPLKAFLQQGLSPDQLALSVAMGFAIGTLPLLGICTFLCVVLSLIFRFNMPAAILVNYLVYPIQLVLMIPFIRAGEWLFNLKPLAFNVNELRARYEEGLLNLLGEVGFSLLGGVISWLIMIILPSLMIYWISKKIFERWDFLNDGQVLEN